jgi:type II secretion system protein C
MSVQAAQRRSVADGRALFAVRAVEAAFVAGLAWIGGLLAWTLFAPESVAPIAPVAAPAAATAPAGAAIDRSILWRTRPFAPAGAPVPAGTAAPETTLNLRLAGVAAGVGATPGVAFILTPDNRQQAFVEGDTVINGVTLERVLTDHVTIRREGVLEALYLPRATPPGPGAQGPIAPESTAPAAPALTAAQLYDAIQFEAVVREGQVAGMRLARAVDRAVVAAAGLAEGDVLIEIDGRALADIPDFVGAFEGRRGGESIAIVVERSGTRVPLTISFGAEQ